jgi:DNA-binding response OmpR family regulator
METILVIDDEPEVAKMVKEALNRFGFIVELALNGNEGIEKFDTGTYDLVITDVCMPGIDANFIVRHIRNSDNATIPVIGISDTPWLYEEIDFDAFLAKPFEIKALVKEVRRLVAHPTKTAGMASNQTAS